MVIHEITVRYKCQDGSWDQIETYKIRNKQSDPDKSILSEEAPLVRAVSELDEGELGRLPNGELFLLVKKLVTYDLQDYVDDIENIRTYEEKELIKIGYEFPKLLADAIHIPDQVDSLYEIIITAKLNNDDVESCIKWLYEVKQLGIFVEDIMNKLDLIKGKQKGLLIEDIRDVYTLNQISDLYKDLKAIKKAKTILLKSLQLDNHNKYTLNRLGKVSRLSCSYQEGIEYYRKALDVEENAYSYNGLGAIYRDINALHEAERCYLNSLNLNEEHDHRYTHRGLGAVYYDMELYIEGNKHFKLAGYDESFLMRIYRIAKKSNLHEKAVNILRLILEFDKDNTNARNLLNQELGSQVNDEEQDMSFLGFIRSSL